MAFIQLIEYRSSKLDEIQAVDEEWERATEGKRTSRREIRARDRHDPDRYFLVVFFDSYESAMQNSELPETAAAAKKIEALTDGPLTFYDLDVVDDHS